MGFSKALVVVCLVALGAGCCTEPSTYMYSSSYDASGDGVMIWPADEEGANWRYVVQRDHGIHPRAIVHEFELTEVPDWDLADGAAVSSLIAVLPSDSSVMLRAATTRLEAGFSDTHPNAGLHLVRAGFEPFDVASYSELQMRLADTVAMHARERRGTFGNLFDSHFALSPIKESISEIGLTPLAGDEVQFAVFSLMPSANDDEVNMVVTGAEGLREAIETVQKTTREAWAASDFPVEVQHLQTGRLRVTLTRDASSEARTAIYSLLHEQQNKESTNAYDLNWSSEVDWSSGLPTSRVFYVREDSPTAGELREDLGQVVFHLLDYGMFP